MLVKIEFKVKNTKCKNNILDDKNVWAIKKSWVFINVKYSFEIYKAKAKFNSKMTLRVWNNCDIHTSILTL